VKRLKPNEIIKKYRKKAGLTQEELAKQVFVAVNTYSQYETGARKMETEMFLTIMKVFGLDFFFKENHKNSNLVAMDLFLQLKEKVAHLSFSQEVLIGIAYKLYEVMDEEELDERWKEHLLVQVSPRDEEIYVTIGPRTIDFDNFGRVTGSGTTINTVSPWKKKLTDEKLHVKVTMQCYYLLNQMNLSHNQTNFDELVEAVKNDMRVLQQKNSYSDDNPYEFEILVFHIRSSILQIINGLKEEYVPSIYEEFHLEHKFVTPFHHYLNIQKPDVSNMYITIDKIKSNRILKEMMIFFHIQQVGHFYVSLLEKKPNGFEPWDIMHVFTEENFICPYCKYTYTKISASSRCFSFTDEHMDQLLEKIQDNPKVTKALKNYGVTNILKR